VLICRAVIERVPPPSQSVDAFSVPNSAFDANAIAPKRAQAAVVSTSVEATAHSPQDEQPLCALLVSARAREMALSTLCNRVCAG
jgi:hypothetical protein